MFNLAAMEQNRILLYSDLCSIATSDNAEPLVDLQETVPKLKCKYEKLDMQVYLGDVMLVRASVADRLRAVQDTLECRMPGASLLVVYAYRHPDVQAKYFESRLQSITRDNPQLEGAELFEEVHKYVAVPEVAGHPTGAAIDLTITVDGRPIDMGTSIADFSKPDLLPTFAPGINESQKSNRLLLRELMLAQGFAPYNGEWWHFSYGDREWACFYNQGSAIYDQLYLENCTG